MPYLNADSRPGVMIEPAVGASPLQVANTCDVAGGYDRENGKRGVITAISTTGGPTREHGMSVLLQGVRPDQALTPVRWWAATNSGATRPTADTRSAFSSAR